MSAPHFNLRGVTAIFAAEMGRTRRTLLQSVATPVLTTALYFVVFGSAIGGRMAEIDGVPYAAYIVPGLVMLSLLGLRRPSGSLRSTISSRWSPS